MRNVLVVELMWGCCSSTLHVIIYRPASVGKLNEAHDATASEVWSRQEPSCALSCIERGLAALLTLSVAVMPYFLVTHKHARHNPKPLRASSRVAVSSSLYSRASLHCGTD